MFLERTLLAYETLARLDLFFQTLLLFLFLITECCPDITIAVGWASNVKQQKQFPRSPCLELRTLHKFAAMPAC